VRELFGNVDEVVRCWSGEVVRPSVVPVGSKHRDGNVRNVVARHARHPAVAGRAGDDARRGGHAREVVQVQTVAQEREREPGLSDVLLGGIVIACEGEGRIRRRSQKRDIDDPLDPRVQGGVDGTHVLSDAVRRLPGRNEEQEPCATERARHRRAVVVSRNLDDLGARQLRRAVQSAHEEALFDAEARQAPRNASTELAGRTGDGDRR